MVDALLEKAKTYLPADRLGIIDRAYRYAADAHEGQVRRSGEPFIEHPLQTALYLADLRLDANALAAGLLHDVVEDCDVCLEEIEDEFGKEIAGLVDGVTKLTQAEVDFEEGKNGFVLRDSDVDLQQAASLRKMLVAMATDVRVVLIKLADRLHNMRTLHALSPNRRRAIAKETLEIFAPLAHRLGIWEVKWRLEDLAFQHLNNGAYQEISGMLNAKRQEREDYIEGVRLLLQSELDKAGVTAEVTGRPKHIYSIHKKTEKYRRQNLGVDDIHDLFALRVLVESVNECYLALGVVHSNWRPLPGQFDDYIANPKDNLYKSLHTTVLCLDAHPVEVQIRTQEMHRLAEYGVAAHWLYKEGRTSDVEFEEKMTWVRQLLDWQRDVSGSHEFVESFKMDIFQNQVYVYTPKGDLKELPAGATPLDFAFRIHTDIGHRCIGAKVNGKLVALTYTLQNGDTVEIMTSKAVRGPSLDWLNPNLGYLNSNSARTKVRQWFNRQERRANIERGKDIFRRQLRRLNLAMTDEELATVLGFSSTDEFMVALGGGEITVEQVVDRISNQEIPPDSDFEKIYSVPVSSPASGIEVLGVGDLLTSMANCCTPILGDSIVGYITRTRGVTVHRRNCHNIIAEQETERLVPVAWSKAHELHPVRVRLEAQDRVGLLRDITSLVSEEGVNIASCVSEEEKDVSIVSLTVYVDGISQLNRLFSKMESVRGVIGVSRARV
jgi:guanosine-3',5'-bis(diphosphate) 3'-pyrophosphohydrolase